MDIKKMILSMNKFFSMTLGVFFIGLLTILLGAVVAGVNSGPIIIFGVIVMVFGTVISIIGIVCLISYLLAVYDDCI